MNLTPNPTNLTYPNLTLPNQNASISFARFARKNKIQFLDARDENNVSSSPLITLSKSLTVSAFQIMQMITDTFNCFQTLIVLKTIWRLPPIPIATQNLRLS